MSMVSFSSQIQSSFNSITYETLLETVSSIHSGSSLFREFVLDFFENGNREGRKGKELRLGTF